MSAICVLTGGGISGAVAAARHRDDGEILLLHMDYGQPSAKAERVAIDALTGWFPKARHVRIDVPAIAKLAPGSAGSGKQNTAESSLSPAAMRGVMPLIFSTGAQYALRVGAKQLITGLSAHAEGSHLGLTAANAQTDGRHELVHTLNLMIDLLAPDTVELNAPLMDLRYSEVIRLGMRFGVPLDHTWTCAAPGPRPCGRCDPCRARERAFAEAKTADPLLRETPAATMEVSSELGPA